MSGIAACLVLLAIVVVMALMPSMWARDYGSFLSMVLADRKKSLLLVAWYLGCGLSGAGIGCLGWQYFRMLLGRSSIIRSAVGTGLAIFGISFLVTAISAAGEFSRHKWGDGFLHLPFVVLFGGASVAHYSWLRRSKAAGAIR